MNGRADPPESRQREQARSHGIGLLCALLGFGLFPVGDTLVKSMAGAWPGTAIATMRYLYAALFLGTFLLARSGWRGFVVERYDLQLARGLAIGISAMAFFFSVQLMPLAEATSIQFTSPIIVALLSPMLLGERTNRAAILCSLLALAGMVTVLRPNAANLGYAALLPVVAALCMALLVIFNRKVAGGSSSVLALQFWVAAMAVPVALTAAVAGHLSGAEPLRIDRPDPVILLKCAGIAATGTIGHWLLYIGTQRASASLVAPMVYFQLIVAGVLGWLVFGHGLDPLSVAGMLVIVLAGLLLWYSQRNPTVSPPPE